MKGKIITINEAKNIAKRLRNEGKSIVLAGGCFDVLHAGHIAFLEKAKKSGDILMVLLESDKKIKNLKGKNRPLQSQKDRASILSAINYVDYVVLLPYLASDNKYDDLVFAIKPAIIATTKGDPLIYHKKRQAKKINAKVYDIVERVKNSSTSRIAKTLGKEI